MRPGRGRSGAAADDDTSFPEFFVAHSPIPSHDCGAVGVVSKVLGEDHNTSPASERKAGEVIALVPSGMNPRANDGKYL